MHAELLKALNNVRSSYWFIPGCLMLVAIALALGVRSLGELAALSDVKVLERLWLIQPETARGMLVTIGSSVLGVAGVIFSITIVAVSYASGNHGPRLITSFMNDRGSQYTLGVFIGTFVYCLLVLSSATPTDGSAGHVEYNLPVAVVPVAVVLMLISIVMLIYFLHHATSLINVENIVAGIGCRLVDQVETLFPHGSGVKVESEVDPLPRKAGAAILATSSGYIQAVDIKQLDGVTTEAGLDLRLHYRPGDFVVPGNALMSLYSPDDIDDDLRDALLACVATGNQRTEPQNILFGFEQLVEVVVRALSPGVNDPSTAITCFNWMKYPLMKMLRKGPDQTGLVRVGRVRVTAIDPRQVLETVFATSLEHVVADSSVTCHVVALLAELARAAEREEERELLTGYMEDLANAARDVLQDPVSKSRVEQRHKEARDAVDDRELAETLKQKARWFGGSG